jgi:hypothetical protein
MFTRPAVLVLGVTASLAAGAFAARRVERALRLEVGARTGPATDAAGTPSPLSLRLVDAGGVGVPTDTGSWAPITLTIPARSTG